MPCTVCGSWDHNRSACPLGKVQACDDLLDLIELGDVLDAPPLAGSDGVMPAAAVSVPAGA